MSKVYKRYIITVAERDQAKARELRSMLRNYRGDEVLPGVSHVTLNGVQHRTILSNADQMGGALRFVDPPRGQRLRA